MSLKSLNNQTYTNKSLYNSVNPVGAGTAAPVITSIVICDSSYTNLDDTALDPAGSYVKLIGTGFKSGCSVYFNNESLTATFVSSTEVRIQTPATSVGAYNIMLFNPTNQGGAIYLNLSVSNAPSFTTGSGTLGSYYEANTISNTIVASGDTPLSYSLYSGSLPEGATLNSDGTITGTSPAESGSTTYSFVVNVKDAQGQDATRSFSLTINTDPVTWSSPNDNQVISAYEYTPISNVTLSAATAAGKSITYSANALPGGITLNGSTISGTNNVVGNTYTRLTATAATTGRTATRDVLFNVNQDVVTWSTPSTNQVISAYEYSAISNVTANATSAAGFGVLYSANDTPTGITLNPSTGLISGTPTTVGNTYSQLTATANTTNRSNTQNIIYNINQDVVTWSSPANNTEYTIAGGSAMANVTMSATSAAGKSIIYSANALPSGVYIDGGTLYGTPDTAQTVYTLLTAQATTTNRTATRTISWTISLGDTYWKYNTLLLSADNTVQTPSFVSDNSINNQQLTVAGDARPSNFNPYQQGYYSNYFDGNGDYLTTPSSSEVTLGSGDFTIEFWVNLTSASATWTTLLSIGSSATAGREIRISQYHYTFGTLGVMYPNSTNSGDVYYENTGYTLPLNTWNHVAVCRSGSNMYLFANGQLKYTYSSVAFNQSTTSYVNIGNNPYNDSKFAGHMSNLRIVKGNALYTSSFTPSTTPLTAVSGTSLLTCQSNRFIDNSLNNFTITKNGDVTASSPHPFSTVYQAGTPYYSTNFNSTSDWLDTTAMSLSGDFTMEAWIYPTQSKTYADIFTSVSANFELGLNNSSLVVWDSGSITITHQTEVTFNRWHHVALTRSGTTMYLYLDGVRSSLSSTSSTTFVPYRIGAYSNTERFVGNISNLRVVTGTVLYSGSTISVPTLPLTAVAGTVLLTCQDSTFKDNSTNNYTITPNTTTVKPVAVSPFTPSSYTNTEITTYGSGYFDGSSAYIKDTTSPVANFGTGDFTWEAWLYSNSTNTTNEWDIFEAQPTSGTFQVYRSTSNSLLYGTYGVAGNNITPVNPQILFQWYHLAIVRISGTVKTYINGVYQATYNDTTNYNQVGVSIGARNTGANFYPGYISNMRIVKGRGIYTSNFIPSTTPLTNVANTTLLTCQTNGSHNNSTFKDSSSFNNVITRNGNVTNGTFSPYGDNWSYYLSGAVITGPNTNRIWADVNEDFTFECWFNLSSAATDNMLMGWNKNPEYDYIDINANGYNLNMNNSYTVSSSSTTWKLGTWYHFAVSRNSNEVKVYINGTLDVTVTNSNSIGSGTTPMIIGSWYTGAPNYFRGNISNLRWVKGTGLYPNGCTPSTTPLTAVANTSLLTAQSNRLVDNSPNNYTLSSSGLKAQKFSPFGTVTVPKYYSTYFNGSTDYLTAPYSSSFVLSGDFTIECWLYWTSHGSYGGVVGCADSNTSQGISAGWFLDFSSTTNKLQFEGQGGVSILTTNTIPQNQWVHIAVVRSGSTITHYLNGTTNGSGSSSTTFDSTNQTLKIGVDRGTSSRITGYISNLRIVKGTAIVPPAGGPTAPLTAIANTVLLTCQNNTFVDNSSNNFTITAATTTVKPLAVSPFTPPASASATSYSPTAFGGSMYFDGTGDYLKAPQISFGTGDFTIECWSYLFAKVTGTPTIFSNYETWTTGALALFAGHDSATTTTYNVSSNGTFPVINAGTIRYNRWQHLALVRSGNTLSLYVDGISVGTADVTGVNYTGVGSSIYIGTAGDAVSTGYIQGYLSDYKITRGVALYKSNFYPGLTPLTPTTTIGANTYSSNLLLTGTSGGVIDASRTVDLETLGDAKVTNFSPYNGSYYSNLFDGSSSYFTATTSTAFPIGTENFTVEMWINKSNAWNAVNQVLMISGTAGSFQLWVDASVPAIKMSFNGGATPLSYNTASLSLGTWYHLAVTRNGNNFTMYINGTSVTTGTDSGSFTTPSSIIIANYSSGTSNIWNGYISNLRVVRGNVIVPPSGGPTGPLTAVSGTSLLTCQSNKFIDNSSNAFTLTPSGTPKVQTQNPFQVNSGQSYYFDGTGDYLSAPITTSTALGSSDFTIESWMYFADTSDRTLIYWNANSSGYAAVHLRQISGKWALWISTSGSGWAVQQSTLGSSIVSNTWYHVAIVRSGTNIKLYVNGSDVTSGGYTVSGSLMTTYTLNQIGVYNTSFYLMNGYISDLRITTGYARTITVPSSPVSNK